MSPHLSIDRRNGFALVEVLVGLAIISIAMLAGLRAIANGAGHAVGSFSADDGFVECR